MEPMINNIRFSLVGLIVLWLVVPAFAGQKNPSASINVVVVREANGKPVKNAEVVLHPVDPHGKQKEEGLELKTHDDGKAEVSGLAYGKWRIQVIAPGFKTFGQDYEVGQPSVEITIKLQKPSEQYSIYK
jgi:5-hydroxyisourate hydrolase-like protein (transthyretin family)